jgi:hypothetical protein
MYEQLTTGQMIDKLKIGEIADGISGIHTYVVTKLKSGEIVFLDEDDEATILDTRLDDKVLSATWTIRPKFVTFEEAKKAYEEGKTVISYLENHGIIKFDKDNEMETNIILTKRIFEGKWIIED